MRCKIDVAVELQATILETNQLPTQYVSKLHECFFGQQSANDSIRAIVIMWKFQIKPKKRAQPNHCSNIEPLLVQYYRLQRLKELQESD